MASTLITIRVLRLLFLIGTITILAFKLTGSSSAVANSSSITQLKQEDTFNNQGSAGSSEILYLPYNVGSYPWQSPFGVESNRSWDPETTIFQQGVDLNISWARLHNRVSWRKLQPNEGDPINWEMLSEFEKELMALKLVGITPIVIIHDSPRWATIYPTSCAAIRADKFEAFASFVRSLVLRYKAPEFNVHHWEIGNEPDVDPSLVQTNNVFGCWGDIDDPYYGGEHYGEMLKVIGPVIKEADPAAQVWIGGLLLATPNTTDPKKGKPELFFKGILEAGAAPYFDIVAYHWYPPFLNKNIDYDMLYPWKDWGGGTVGKAKYLRQLMAQYEVSKPVFLNETSLICVPFIEGSQIFQFVEEMIPLQIVEATPNGFCDPPPSELFQMQADYVVRSFVRAYANGIMGYSWYTLNGPGFMNNGLLDEDDVPRPSYIVYKQLIAQLRMTRYVGRADYGGGIEAYAFKRGNEILHVAWTVAYEILNISVQADKFIAAYDRDGNLITPTLVDGFYVLHVGFGPIYILLSP